VLAKSFLSTYFADVSDEWLLNAGIWAENGVYLSKFIYKIVHILQLKLKIFI